MLCLYEQPPPLEEEVKVARRGLPPTVDVDGWLRRQTSLKCVLSPVGLTLGRIDVAAHNAAAEQRSPLVHDVVAQLLLQCMLRWNLTNDGTDTAVDGIAFDVYVHNPPCTPPAPGVGGTLRRVDPAWSVRDALESATCAVAHSTRETQLMVVLRWRGGKGGFGKNLAKKGRQFIKAQRRGETDATLVRHARNLQGERIGTTAAPAAEGGASTRAAQDGAPKRPTAEEVQAALAAVRREHETKLLEREDFGRILRDAVMEGFRTTATQFKQQQQQEGAPQAQSPSPH